MTTVKQQKYIFVHFLGIPNEHIIQFINQIASEFDLNIICFANNYSVYILKAYTFVDGTPYDYVSLIENASFVFLQTLFTHRIFQ